VSPLKRTWALCGETPARRKIRLHFQAHGHSITGEEVKRFLTHLLQQIPGPIILVWDRHPIHRRTSVQEFIEAHPRLHVYEFPTSAPELNPAEMVWTQISEYASGTASHNTAELYDIVYAAIARTRRSRRRLWACIYGSELPWTRSSVEH
jgi:transposase